MMKYFCMSCGTEYEPNVQRIKCDCGNALWIKANNLLTRSDLVLTDFSMWRYAKVYPLKREDISISFNESITPLATARIGKSSILVKMDSLMPTGSFKDRGAAMVVNYLANQGISRISEDSSGNGGSAYAGYAAKGGLKCDIYVPRGTSLGKTAQTKAYGANCIEVDGTREDVAMAAINSASNLNTSYVGHNWHPLFIEGVKSIAYEIWEQCGYAAPDNFVVPAGNGSLLAAAFLGFSELLRAGEIHKIPRLFGIQSKAVNPFVQYFNTGKISLAPTHTMAEGIRITRSSRLVEIDKFVRSSSGRFIDVSEIEISAALKEMSEQGFFIEPTSATAFAGIRKLIENGDIHSSEKTVGVITGNGLKATEKLIDLLNLNTSV